MGKEEEQGLENIPGGGNCSCQAKMVETPGAGLHERMVRSDVWWGIAGEPGLCIWRRVGSICRWTQRQRAVKSPVQQLHGVLCNEH